MRPLSFEAHALWSARQSLHDSDAELLITNLDHSLPRAAGGAPIEAGELASDFELDLLPVEELYIYAFTQGVLWALEMTGVDGLLGLSGQTALVAPT